MATTSVSVTIAAAAAATQANGYMQADGFSSPVTLGQPLSSTTGGHSNGPARHPFGLSMLTAVVAAAGASAGNAVPITAQVVKVTASTSTEGVILVTTVGSPVFLTVPGAHGAKVYPPTGAGFGTATANVPKTIAAGKGAIFTQISATEWDVIVGA